MKQWVAAIFALGVAGCAAQVVPPTPPANQAAVYLTNYGRHSSLLLPAREGHYVEFAFGDWNWFAVNHNSSGDALEAMLFSAGATLGRRQLKLSDDIDAICRATGALTVSRIPVPREKVDALLDKLDQKFQSQIDTITYNPASSMWFVADDEPYCVLHNCNHVTARWLRALGCDVRGLVMYSNFKVVPPPRTAAAH